MATLFQRLGGQEKIGIVMDKFYSYMMADPTVNHFFLNSNTNMQKQAQKMKQFISKVTGGPDNYQGKDLRTAHQKFKISQNDFDVTWKHLERAMKEFKMDEKLISEAKKVFYSFQKDILKSQSFQGLNKQKEGQKSLFMRLGGEEVINVVVDRLYELQLNDPITAPVFKGVDTSKLAKRYKQYLTMLTGGPSKYTGTDLKSAHQKHHIGKQEFEQFFRNLEKALREQKVNQNQISELKSILHKMEKDIESQQVQ